MTLSFPLCCGMTQPRWGWVVVGGEHHPQGSGYAATLGYETESRWDKGDNIRYSWILSFRGKNIWSVLLYSWKKSFLKQL